MSPAGKKLLARGAVLALGVAIWFAPVPAGLTARRGTSSPSSRRRSSPSSWPRFPLLTAAMLAVGGRGAHRHHRARQGLRGLRERQRAPRGGGLPRRPRRREVGLGRRISLLVVSAFGRSTLGLAYSIFLTRRGDRAGLPEQHRPQRRALPDRPLARPGRGLDAGRRDPKRLGGYLMFCGMASLAVSSALWLTATSANPIGVEIARAVRPEDQLRLVARRRVRAGARRPRCSFRWCCTGCFLRVCARPPSAPAAAREALRSMGPLSRDEKVVAARSC